MLSLLLIGNMQTDVPSGTQFQFWEGAAAAFLIIVVVYTFMRATGHIPASTSRLADLEGMVRILQADRRNDLARIEKLEAKLKEVTTRNTFLEARLAIYEPVGSDNTRVEQERVLLAVVGSGPELRMDLTALREVEAETNIIVTRCYPARFGRFEATLNRHRASGNPIRYVHFSAHATAGKSPCAAAVLFEGEEVNADRLSGVMNGVEVAFVAGCDSEMLGDLLGIVPLVVTFKEPVRHEQAALAAKLFWLSIGKGMQPRQAYRETRAKLPSEAAEFLEIHQ